MTLTLPDPIGPYFAAANRDDPDGVAAGFAQDALVHDEGHDINGRDTIRAWAAESRAKYQFTATPTAIAVTAEEIVVTAHLVGAFPGSPVDLRYRFQVADGLINRLEIG